MKKTIFLIVILTVLSLNFTVKAQNTLNTNNEQTMNEVLTFLKTCGYYFLATTDGDQPHVRPFGTSEIFEGKLYIQTGKRKNVAKQMLANPKIEICAYNTKDGSWIRIEALAFPDERREVKQYMLDMNPSLKRMYSVEDDNTLVLYLKDVTATFYTFSGEPKVIKF
jgi:uncharacterized pyridoxamine 5'-phosphate oxidase family protein